MLGRLTLRAVLVVLGLLLIAAFIWFAGPYFAFADRQPLASSLSRLIVIGLVAALWAGSAVVKRLRANRASDQLAAAVVKQAAQDRPTAEAAALQEKFEDAVATLKAGRRGGHGLYDLPWYVIIGAPGSGKTTALVNSGLKFPLEQRSGKGALRGVGGTRNCDWWFTDEAVLLDTAGRYTTQDSDASADSAAWVAFLGLLKKYRKRRPVNGVILAISAQDLMVQSQGSLEAHVAAARRRLQELNKELRVRLPVYLMVTKCDLVAGFSEYFDDLDQSGRAQVWGVTFPYEHTRAGEAARHAAAEFDALIQRLNERLLARLEEDHDPKRRAKIFAFPQQMAALGEPLLAFVTDVFASTRFETDVLLRGIYFTSGTQEGTPIDRLLGALGRRFAVAPEALVPAGRGRAYFIERLLKDVLFAESGLAGVNRRVEMQKAALQLGGYAAMALLAILGLLALSVSYTRNRAYVEAVGEDVALLRQALEGRQTPPDSLLPRLDLVRAVVDSAERHQAGVPWSMRWGLYQGHRLSMHARDAYARELSGTLLSQVAARVRQRLAESAGDPVALFFYLKAHLMLGDPARLDKEFLARVADLEWNSAQTADPVAAAAFSQHFRQLLDLGDTLRPFDVDAALVAQARRSLPPDAAPQLIYGWLKHVEYAGDAAGALRLDSLGADQVFRRRSGVSLSAPMRALYTKPVFEEIVSTSAGEIEQRFTADRWVWGESPQSSIGSAQLRAAVIDLYEKDYIAAWDDLLEDIELVSLPGDVDRTRRVLTTLAGTASPLRGLLEAVDANTHLLPPPGATQGGAVSTVRGRIEQIEQYLGAGRPAGGVPTVTPGAQVTAHFKPVHDLVAGEPGKAPIDGLLDQIRQLAARLGPGGGSGPLGAPDIATAAAVAGMSEELKARAKGLPGGVAGLMVAAGESAHRAAVGGATSEIENQYQQDVVRRCRAALSGRYPFVPGSPTDVQIADFSDIFAPGGAFDTFFKTRLQQLVNTTRSPWTWHTDASGTSVGLRNGQFVLRQFYAAQQIREMFFPAGSSTPEVRFVLTPFFLDPQATLFRLELDGQKLEYRHDAERDYRFEWPGEAPGGVIASFEGAGGRPNIALRSPWAWFRLLEGRLRAETDGSFMLTVQAGGRTAQVRVRPLSNVRHPFGKPDLQNFRCEP